MIRPFALLALLLCLPVLAAPKSVPVSNGDFEQGLAGWSFIKPTGFANGNATIETKDVHSGKQAVRIVNETGEKVLFGLVTDKPIALPDDNRTFAITAWMKSNVSPQSVEIRVASSGKDGKILTPWQENAWRFLHPPLEPHRGQWAQMRLEFGARPNWGGFQLTFWVNGSGADVIVDDIQVETIDAQEWRVPSAGKRLPDPVPGVALWTESPQVKVYPGDAAPREQGAGLQLSAAGGEYACAQLCLRSDKELADLRVGLSSLKGPQTIPADALYSNFVGLVTVREALSGRSMLGDTPDPLLTDPQLTVPAGQSRSVWVTIKVPRGTPAGEYSGRVSLTGTGLSATVPLNVTVHGFDLPERPSLRTIARIWGTHPGYDHLFRKNLQEHRCGGTNTLGGIKASREEGSDKVTVDLSGLHEAIENNLKRFNLTVFNVPSIFLGDASGFFNKEKKWFGFDIMSPAFDAAYEDYCRKIGDALRAEGVLQYAIWQVWDEPQNEEMLEAVEHLIGLVKKAVPEAKVYMTTGIKPELINQVGIWCLPWPSTYNGERAAQAKATGAELWAYDNSLYALDAPDSSLLLRHYLWMLRKYSVTGVEWWAISQWNDDPWKTTNQYKPQNGGGYFLYPTPERKGAPINSIRWEMYREGVEDYDILTMLGQEQDRTAKAAICTDPRLSGERQVQELIAQVAPHLGQVKRDPLIAEQVIEKARRRLGLFRTVPGAVIGEVTENGKQVILLATGNGTQLYLNGKLNKAKVASVTLGEKPVVVQFKRGTVTHTLHLEQ
ncbi:MAG: glycoside hydrolase domain-containing protein [Armatimonadota bacterium]